MPLHTIDQNCPITAVPMVGAAALCGHTQEQLDQVQFAVCDWAQDLHRRLSADSATATVCFSPASIAPVLGMLLAAMEDRDVERFKIALGLGEMSTECVHSCLGAMSSVFSVDTKELKITAGNGMAVLDVVSNEYKSQVSGMYGAEVFQTGPSAHEAAEEINNWVSEKTRALIPELVSAGDLMDVTAVLLNALYFKGEWCQQFKASNTRSADFRTAQGEAVTCQMMSQDDYFHYAENAECQALQMHFQTAGLTPGSVYMLALLPNDPNGLEALEQSLSAEFIEGLRHSSGIVKVDVGFPKLDIKYDTTSLLKHLSDQGFPMKVSLPKVPADGVSKMIHKTVLKVDETGAEGAAATALFYERCACVPDRATKFFSADRPFLCVLVAEGNILFQAAIKDASALAS
ncbi:MAG: serpin family protein [Chlamydiia bacterium]|nr:serpin family protein [Chlamydiia bacterium]